MSKSSGVITNCVQWKNTIDHMDHTVALQLLASRQPASHFALLLLLVPANLSIPREPESQTNAGNLLGCG